MQDKIKEIDELFKNKIVYEEAMGALVNSMEIQARVYMDDLVKRLELKLKEYDFIVVSHAHYDNPKYSIINTGVNEKTHDISVIDFKVTEIKGERNEKFDEVIKITEEFFEEFYSVGDIK